MVHTGIYSIWNNSRYTTRIESHNKTAPEAKRNEEACLRGLGL